MPVTIVTAIGEQAAAVLDEARENARSGSVVAVTERSCHLLLPTGLVCLASTAIGNGPVNLVCQRAVDVVDTDRRDLFGCLQCNQRVVVTGSRLIIGEQVAFSMQSSQVWESLLPVLSIPVCDVLDKVSSLVELAPPDSLMVLAGRNPLKGCTKQVGTGLATTLDQATLEYLSAPVFALSKDLYRWINTPLSSANGSHICWSPSVAKLIGAGKGLTPAGDDLLAGVLLTLNYLGRRDIAQSLFAWLEPMLKQHTTFLSSTLLSLAARAMAGESVIRLFQQLDTSTQFAHLANAKVLNDIGHTSGWDCFAGIQLTLTAAVAESATAPRIAALGRGTPSQELIHA